MDISQFSFPTDLGHITINWTEKPEFKVTKITLLRTEASGPIFTENEKIMSLAIHIGLAVQGRPIPFDLKIFAFDKCHDFQRKVLLAEYGIPRGKISTYGRIAKHIGNPGAARAVGTALATNPFPLVIPCHRAVRSNGEIGEYQGGTDMKRTLLRREGVKFISNTRVDMSAVHY